MRGVPHNCRSLQERTVMQTASCRAVIVETLHESIGSTPLLIYCAYKIYPVHCENQVRDTRET